MPLPYTLLSGCGNTFIHIDNREKVFPEDVQNVIAACHKLEADGLILLEKGAQHPLRMRLFNRDGSEPAMCGNGLRCLYTFLDSLGIQNKMLTVETPAGPRILSRAAGEVTTTMGNVKDLQLHIDENIHFLDTGVPHVVCFVDNVETCDVATKGAHLRHDPRFQPAGANVNFVQVVNNQSLEIRTFERGVEGETAACGTGATAAAVVAGLVQRMEPPIRVTTRSQETLTVSFRMEGDNVKELTQTGPTTYIHQGTLSL